jgi:hypothetical protein
MLREPGPERGIADIVGHISDQQIAGGVNHFSNEAFLREGVESVALLMTIGRIDYRPDMFVLSYAQVADMVVVVIQTATGWLNVQVIVRGWLVCIILSQPQSYMLLDQ